MFELWRHQAQIRNLQGVWNMSGQRTSFWDLPPRGVMLVIGAVIGVAAIGLLTVVLGDRAARIVLDRGGSFPYPFTIQNLMLMLFFVGLGELFVRWRTAVRERAFARQGYLPEDEATVLVEISAPGLGEVYERIALSWDDPRVYIQIPF